METSGWIRLKELVDEKSKYQTGMKPKGKTKQRKDMYYNQIKTITKKEKKI